MSGPATAMRLALTLVVFGLDVWAIVNILGTRAPARSKLGWTVAVTALPLAGFIAWKIAGPKPYRTGEGR